MYENINSMLLEKLIRYVTEPLYTCSQVNVLNESMVLRYNLYECERRLFEILSYSERRSVHVNMENFPWKEMEELMGDKINVAIVLSNNISDWNIRNKQHDAPSIFKKYILQKQAFFLHS